MIFFYGNYNAKQRQGICKLNLAWSNPGFAVFNFQVSELCNTQVRKPSTNTDYSD